MPKTDTDTLTARWDKIAADLLVGRTITAVNYMNAKEASNMGFYSRPVVFQLDNGTLVCPQSDDEGNDGGALVFLNPVTHTEQLLPVLR